MTRRELLAVGAASVLAAQDSDKAMSDKALLGGSPTCFSVRAQAAKRDGRVFDVVEHCHTLGLAGAESGAFNPTPDAVKAMRGKIEAYGMVLVLNVPLPKTEADVDQFDKSVGAAKEAGASALHAAMTQRRYEQFATLEAFKQNFAECQRSVELAEPILSKHRLPLAIENHKGWRATEQAAWMKRVSSEWVGVCLDMGNNISLCEMPDETFELLTPYAIFSHIKDIGLESYPHGFLLAEVPFGQGVINLKERITQLRRKNPKMLFCLEMITRKPLKIPVFTDQYWVTLPDVPAHDLAKVLDLVRTNPPKVPLPQMDQLSPEQQLAAEDRNNLACIQYARQNLNM